MKLFSSLIDVMDHDQCQQNCFKLYYQGHLLESRDVWCKSRCKRTRTLYRPTIRQLCDKSNENLNVVYYGIQIWLEKFQGKYTKYEQTLLDTNIVKYV